MEDTNQGGNKKIYVAIIVLLLLINGVALYLLWKENRAKNVLAENKVKHEANVKGLTDTLSAKQVELQAFMGKNAELDSVITDQIAQIEEQKKKIESLQRS